MLYSLLLKLAMLVVTMSVVFWIGWSMPQPWYVDADHGSDLSDNEVPPVHSSGAPVVSATGASPLDQPHAASPSSRRTVIQQLDLNRATEQDFEALPGIGPVLAERIVRYRQSRGGFTGVDQLRKVKGIGSKTFDRIRALVSVTTPSISSPGGRKAT